MTKFSTIRFRVAAVLMVFTLALSGCFMSPGKFTSELAITGPDSFTFNYEGEIFFLGLSKLAQTGAGNSDSFTASCMDEDTYETRTCTPEEEAMQREAWEADAAERDEQAKNQAQQMAALMGGIDPTDPKAAEELVRLLLRQKGWERVVHKGDGVFDVSYRISGTMSHDFSFPVIEGFPQANPFVQVFLRNGGQMRVNAPGFAAQSPESGGLAAMLGAGAFANLAAMGAAEAAGEAGQDSMPGVPVMDGTFTVRTAIGMRILANNTDEGPTPGANDESLTWRISAYPSGGGRLAWLGS
ncbi:MAG: hypothetical protein GW858_07535, partial [Sphingomonadales bacterium]|nr:hypothetical protein [Sphingomonadales bacterium]